MLGIAGEQSSPLRKLLQFNSLGIQSLLLGGNCPLAVPEKIIGLTLILDFFDRGAKKFSLYRPLGALEFICPLHKGAFGADI